MYYVAANQAASDLAATNIQRGRDHGIANYNDVRRLAGLKPIADMRENPKEINRGDWIVLASLYQEPNDIDLFTGGLAEMKVNGGILGPTLSWLIGRQFHLYKFGDRFFFTHTKGLGAMGLPENLQVSTLTQLFQCMYKSCFPRQEMIHSRSLSDVFCETVASLGAIQKNALLIPNRQSNPVSSCKDPARAKINYKALVDHILGG